MNINKTISPQRHDDTTNNEQRTRNAGGVIHRLHRFHRLHVKPASLLAEGYMELIGGIHHDDTTTRRCYNEQRRL